MSARSCDVRRLRPLGVLALLLVAACSEPPGLDERPFPTLTGPFAVGVQEMEWVDAARPNPFTVTAEDVRRVAVRIWYPAEPVAAAEPALYIFDLEEFRSVHWIQGGLTLRTNAVLEAALARAEAPFPVLLYSAGGGYPRFIGSALGEEMASHGYVVVAVGHDGFNHAQRAADGAELDDGSLRRPELTGDLRVDILADSEYYDTVHFPQWLADCRFALGRLTEMNRAESGFLAGKMQLEQVGAYGWSFGGATAIQLLASEPRVIAAVNFDGQLFGDADRLGTDGAFLILRSSHVYLPSAGDDSEEAQRKLAIYEEMYSAIDARFQAMLTHSAGPGEIWRIAGTKHPFFSDLLLLGGSTVKIYAGRFDAGDLEPARGHELLSTTLREFFGQELLGVKSEFLADPSATFPEIEVGASDSRRD